MNIERMLTLADVIEDKGRAPAELRGVDFNMEYWAYSPSMQATPQTVGHVFAGNICGTACCIAGWACLLFGERSGTISRSHAQGLLGLSEEQSRALFMNGEFGDSDEPFIAPNTPEGEERFEEITREEAADAIRRMVELERATTQ